MHLDQIVKRIDNALGEELPFTDRTLEADEREVLWRVFGDRGYQVYLQDQVNRQVIRDYLTNAVVLGYLPEQAIQGLSDQMSSRDGRAALSLQMLMSSVEQAAEFSSAGEDTALLKPLDPRKSTPPYIRLIQK